MHTHTNHCTSQGYGGCCPKCVEADARGQQPASSPNPGADRISLVLAWLGPDSTITADDVADFLVVLDQTRPRLDSTIEGITT